MKGVAERAQEYLAEKLREDHEERDEADRKEREGVATGGDFPAGGDADPKEGQHDKA